MEPTFQNVPYGPHERNVLDVYKVPSKSPSPIFVWIHGGGFYFGDKSERGPRLVPILFDQGISLVTINYRFSQHAIYPAPYYDCRRAFQFVRYHAPSWGLDPQRIAAGGLSAGAAMSLWLGFRPDMAESESDDPIEREPTRPTCIYIVDGQTSYDPRFISQLIGGKVHIYEQVLADLFGVPRDVWPHLDERAVQLVEDGSPINFLSQDAPPVLCAYNLSREHEPDIHHPQFGDDLKERMDTLNLECTVVVNNEDAIKRLNKDQQDGSTGQITFMDGTYPGDFLARHLSVS